MVGFAIIAGIVWIIMTCCKSRRRRKVNRKLGRMLRPGMGSYFFVMAAFCAATLLEGSYMLAAAEASVEVEEPEHEAEIGIEQFSAVELRVAEVLECENIPKAKKLLKLQVDLGYEKRQVVSGIAKFYKPEDLIGKKVAIVANLKPVKLCGVDSCGMILASGEEDVTVLFLDPSAKNGDRIR